MAFNAEQLAYASKAAIDFYMKNKPVDQINKVRPWYSKLDGAKKNWKGGLQNVVEQLRISNDSNFQAYFGDGQVSYNRKRTLNQAKFTWGSFHDGFGLNEDELAQVGIAMTDDRGSQPTADEKVALTDLLEENMQTLELGFEEGMDKMLLRDGTQSTLEIPGLDYLVSLHPTAGTVGGIPASNTYWQNYADLQAGSTANPLLDAMETAWRACITFGGQAPDFLQAGSDFVDAYRAAAKDSNGGGIQVTTQVGDSSGNRKGISLDAGVGNGVNTGLYFKGVEIVWNPTFDTLDAEDNPTVDWASRLYMLNMATIKLRPIQGHWKVTRRPPRVYDRYVHYTAMTAKAALTTNKRNGNAVLALA